MNETSRTEKLPWGKGVVLAARDENGLMAVEKPVGVLSHPNRKDDLGKALLRAPYDEELQAYRVPLPSGQERLVYLLNRLDSATSGLVLLCCNPDVKTLVLEAFASKRVRKVYQALVFGAPRRGAPVWRDRLTTRQAEGGVRSSVGDGALAETRVLGNKPLLGQPMLSLLTLMPLTGRTHQLRIQAAKRGNPIVGDRTYGDFRKNKQIAQSRGIKRLCLHCVETELEYALGGKKFRFSAKSPSPF